MTPREKITAGATALPDNRVGCACWWSASLIEADPAQLRAAMQIHADRYTDLVRQPVGPHAAMRRALRRCSSGMPEGFVWREVGIDKAAAIAGNGAASPETELVIAYAREHTDVGARTYDAKDQWTISVNDVTGIVRPSLGTLAGDGLAQFNRVMERYRKERMFLTQEDLRALMLRIFLEDSQGSRMKRQGSIYFIPSMPVPMKNAKGDTLMTAAGHAELRAADEIIDELAPALEQAGLEMLRIPILTDDIATMKQVGGAVAESILDEIEAMRKEAEQRVQAVRTGNGKASTLQKRLEDAAALRTKARVYRDLLGIGLDDAEKSLKLAEEMIQSAMDEAAAKITGSAA